MWVLDDEGTLNLLRYKLSLLADMEAGLVFEGHDKSLRSSHDTYLSMQSAPQPAKLVMRQDSA